MKIYDAENHILGRLASVVAKQLLNGESVAVVKVEKIVIAGNPKDTLKTYLEKTARGDPIHGPFFPKTPDGIFKRTVRGMVPRDRTHGREAYKRLRVYTGVPDELKTKMEKFERIKGAEASKLKCRRMFLGDLSLLIGSKKRW
jgi:large subunit ribosomal protein L13